MIPPATLFTPGARRARGAEARQLDACGEYRPLPRHAALGPLGLQPTAPMVAGDALRPRLALGRVQHVGETHAVGERGAGASRAARAVAAAGKQMW